MSLITAKDYKTFKYQSDDGERLEWEQLMKKVADECKGEGDLDSCLTHYTSSAIMSLEELPQEIKVEILRKVKEELCLF